jgi:ABC-type oligopeptide transport system substrate-binding subunit
MAGVTAVSAPLDDTVELRLSTPQPELLELLSLPALAVRPRRGSTDEAGPFVREAPEPDAPPLPAGAALLKRNPAFHAAQAVPLAGAVLVPADAETAIARFNRGETDLVLGGGLDGLGAARVTARREALLLEARRSVLLLRVNQGRGPLADRRIRRALQLAVNREALGPQLFGSSAAAPVTALSPPGLSAYPLPAPDWAALPLADRQAEARRLIAEVRGEATDPAAGDAADSPAPLRLVLAVPAGAATGRLVTAIAADLMAVGVELALAPRPAEAHGRAIAAGDFDLALDRIDAEIDSPLPFLLPFQCKANRHGVCLEEADRLLAESWQAPSRAQRLALLATAERLWAEDGAAIGLVQPLGWSLVSARVGGMAANAAGRHPLRYLTLTPDRRRTP